MNLRVFFATLCFVACIVAFMYILYLIATMGRRGSSLKRIMLFAAVLALLFATGVGIAFGG